VRLFRATQDALVLQLGRDEKPAFVELLLRYPVVPAAHQKLSRSRALGAGNEHQQLLDDALHEQRVELQNRIRQWLDERGRFRRVKRGFNFTLLRIDADWLLRVLNDVRVGSWLQLGAPEEMPRPDDLPGFGPTELQAWLGMELSGKFQMELLFALESASPR
jgi:hypothetical protein